MATLLFLVFIWCYARNKSASNIYARIRNVCVKSILIHTPDRSNENRLNHTPERFKWEMDETNDTKETNGSAHHGFLPDLASTTGSTFESHVVTWYHFKNSRGSVSINRRVHKNLHAAPSLTSHQNIEVRE